jgi:hypothetical protein
LPATALMREVFPRWDRYSREGQGEFITPFTPEQVEYLSGMNAGYSFGERFVRGANLSLSLDPISTGIGLFFDVIRPIGGRSVGFDNRSVMPRTQYGRNLLYQQQQMQATVAMCSAPRTAANRGR